MGSASSSTVCISATTFSGIDRSNRSSSSMTMFIRASKSTARSLEIRSRADDVSVVRRNSKRGRFRPGLRRAQTRRIRTVASRFDDQFWAVRKGYSPRGPESPYVRCPNLCEITNCYARVSQPSHAGPVPRDGVAESLGEVKRAETPGWAPGAGPHGPVRMEQFPRFSRGQDLGTRPKAVQTARPPHQALPRHRSAAHRPAERRSGRRLRHVGMAVPPAWPSSASSTPGAPADRGASASASASSTWIIDSRASGRLGLRGQPRSAT